MRTVKIKVGQLWACPTFESWYLGTELKYEGYRVTKIEPYPYDDAMARAFGIQYVEVQHVKAKTIHKIVAGPDWTETEHQKLIEDVP